MEIGLVTKSVSGQYTVKTEKDEYICKPRGLFRKDGFKPLCGDIAEFEITDISDKEGYIQKIKERKNSLIRPPVANVDTSVIVFSINNPKLDEFLIDLLILASRAHKIQSILCINKSDLADDGKLKLVMKEYEKCGCEIIVTDALHVDNLDRFSKVISSGITVFAGQSGAGKSTLINALTKTKSMQTGILSRKIERGKNTTRHCQLLPYMEGYIVDTPGFSKFDPGLLEPEAIKDMYNEFDKYKLVCKFNDCKHINEKGCAVIKAVEENLIPIGRYNRYKMIYNMSKEALKNRRGY
jgi:ribosome biogenesis GTPase